MMPRFLGLNTLPALLLAATPALAGPTAKHILSGSQLGEHCGLAVVGIRDVTGDSIDDLAIGSPLYGSGRVRIFDGANGSAFATWTAFATNLVNQDIKVLMVGAPAFASATNVNAGRVYFFNIESRALLGRLTGTRENGCFGSTLAVMGDIDDNDADEVIIASIHESIQRGKVRVFGTRSRGGAP